MGTSLAGVVAPAPASLRRRHFAGCSHTSTADSGGGGPARDPRITGEYVQVCGPGH